MFRRSPTTTVPELFGSFVNNLEGARYTKFTDADSWHNLFRDFITSRVNEDHFRALFTKHTGSPNASIRVLLGMMILKEGFGWSDERLFEASQFDMLVMSSLGMTNVNDSLPCAATYYNFKQALYKHQIQTGEDLLGTLFGDLTKEQAKLFGVNGKFVRMDSKLIGSNICKSSRLQLIISVVQEFYKDLCVQGGRTERMVEADRNFLGELMKKKSGQIIYTLDNPGREKLLETIGYLLLRLQKIYSEKDSEKYRLLIRVLAEQYSIEGEQVKLKEGKEIKSDTLQSPFDEDATYRQKDEQKVRGYSVNITETCDDEALSLIVDAKVETSNTADNTFLESAIERSQEVIGQVENVNADGAYYSPENENFAKKNGTELVFSGFPGSKGKYTFEVNEGQVTVVNTQSGEIHKAEEYKPEHYKIKEGSGYRYFTKCMIMSFFNRQKMEQIPQQIKNRRNNVEASIFQLSFLTRNNKTRYRGKEQHQQWAFCRTMWLNLKRIKNYMEEIRPVVNEIEKITGILTKTGILLTNFVCDALQVALYIGKGSGQKSFSPVFKLKSFQRTWLKRTN